MSKTVLVTGCRSGLGLGMAVDAAKAGFHVYAGLRDLSTASDLKQAAQDLPVVPIQLDVTSAEDRNAAVAQIEKEQGRLDALINNAGVALGGFLEQVDDDELRAVFEVNVFGAFEMTKACLPLMRSSGGGTVLMISSMSGRVALPSLGAYAASKFALEGMSEAWRHELKPFGIHVVLLEPGAYRTDIFERNRRICRRARDPGSPYAKYIDFVDRLHARVVNKIARDPAEVCEMATNLLKKRRPALRYPVGPGARPRAAIMRFLPFRTTEILFERLLAKAAAQPQD